MYMIMMDITHLNFTAREHLHGRLTDSWLYGIMRHRPGAVVGCMR